MNDVIIVLWCQSPGLVPTSSLGIPRSNHYASSYPSVASLQTFYKPFSLILTDYFGLSGDRRCRSIKLFVWQSQGLNILGVGAELYLSKNVISVVTIERNTKGDFR